MEPFLEQIARHYYEAGKMEKTCFVFPSRRAVVFFRRHLCSLSAKAGKPMLLPRLMTVEDFFFAAARSLKSDRVDLLLTLYDCYRRINPSAEPLDDFIYWGDILMSDFSDLDKYMVDAGMILRNISELKAMQDDFEYLTPEQRRAVEHFADHFRDGAPVVGVKDNFRRIWDMLLPLYREFRSTLSESGRSYEGMVYRGVAERMKKEGAAAVLGEAFPGEEGFVFVGLNVLSAAEQTVLKKMKDASLAEFCWDYSSAMIRNPHNRSSKFMEGNLSLLGQSFVPDEGGLPETKFNVLSVPSASGQAKHLAGILGGDENNTAVILPDEGLLESVLNSIPAEIRDVNVTMGFPLKGSATAAFVQQLCTLQLHSDIRGGEEVFYHKNVRSILSSSLLRASLDESGSALADAVKAEALYYVPSSRFKANSLMERIFRRVVIDQGEASASQVKALGQYLEEALRLLVPALKTAMPQEVEFARRYVECLHRLTSWDLPVLPRTYLRLLDRLAEGESVPYNGEPIKGLQIMGPLEMRALDFDTIIILSCNEGMFPRRSMRPSFIPPELRRGFGMPTYEHQDAIWAYYFYRMIQRASVVWMVYDSRTDKMRSGEESRFIKQLEYHFGVNLQRFTSSSVISSGESEEGFPKPEDMALRMKSRRLSASSLQNWLSCQAKFYYSFIEGLKKEDEVAESLDAGMIGNVFHKTMQALYTSPEAMKEDFQMERIKDIPAMEYVSMDYLKQWADRPALIKARIRSLVKAELKSPEVTGRNLVIEDVILQYVLKTLQRDAELLSTSSSGRLKILGLELERTWKFEGYDFVGYIDRLDSPLEGKVRIVDYKTGKVSEEEVGVDDASAPGVLEALFGEGRDKPKIALQLFLYDMFVSEGMNVPLSNIENSVYPVSKMFTAPPPSAKVSPVFCEGMKERLADLLKDMADPSKPILRTSDRETCEYCDFKNICGR